MFVFRMQDLQQSLVEALSVCQNARSKLNKGQKSFTTASLSILSNYRKRKIVQDVLKSLNTIKTLVIVFEFKSSSTVLEASGRKKHFDLYFII